MAAGSSRLVLRGGIALALALGVHGGFMVHASRLPSIRDLLGVNDAPPAGSIDIEIEPNEAAAAPIDPIGPPALDEVTAPEVAAPDAKPDAQSPDEPSADDHREAAKPEAVAAASPPEVAPAAAPQPAQNSRAAGPADHVAVDPTADETTPKNDAASGPIALGPTNATATGPTSTGPTTTGPTTSGPTTTGPTNGGVDEYGDPIDGPAKGPAMGSSVLSQFALAPSIAAPTTTPGAAQIDGSTVDRVVGATLRSQDKKVSITIPAAGVVSGQVTTSVRALSLPHNTRATIEVTIGAGGKVTSTRVVSSSGGDASQWETATKAIQGGLAGQTLQLGAAAATGAVVRVTVVTKHVYPTGTAKGADAKPVCANQVINDLVDGADNKPADKNEGATVPIFTDENGRPCIPVGVSVVADASNIGANKHIEVQSSVSVSIPGDKDLPVDIAPVNTDAPWVDTGKAGPRPTLPAKIRKHMSDKEKKK